MESHIRSIAKAITWRVGGTLVTFIVVLIFTKKVELSAQIGLLDTILKIGIFYWHERLWNRITFGRKKKPEYYI